MDRNRVFSQESGWIDSIVTQGADPHEYCHDKQLASNGFGFSANPSSIMLASKAVNVNWDSSDNYYSEIQNYSFSDVAADLGCHAAYMATYSGGGGDSGFDFSSLAASIAPLLPQSPAQFRLPTIISSMTGQGTLAANLAVELFSAIWQYVALLLGFKFLKFLRG